MLEPCSDHTETREFKLIIGSLQYLSDEQLDLSDENDRMQLTMRTTISDTCENFELK